MGSDREPPGRWLLHSGPSSTQGPCELPTSQDPVGTGCVGRKRAFGTGISPRPATCNGPCLFGPGRTSHRSRRTPQNKVTPRESIRIELALRGGDAELPREAARLAPCDRTIFSVNRSFSPQLSPPALPAFIRVKGMTHVTALSADSFGPSPSNGLMAPLAT